MDPEASAASAFAAGFFVVLEAFAAGLIFGVLEAFAAGFLVTPPRAGISESLFYFMDWPKQQCCAMQPQKSSMPKTKHLTQSS